MPHQPENRLKSGKIILTGIVLLVLTLPHILTPQEIPVPQCTFHSLTGLSCPTCGITRAFFMTAKGSIGEAMRYHFVGFFLYIGLALYFCVNIAEIIWDQRFRVSLPSVVNKLLLLLFFTSWISFWLLRMLSESF